MSSNKMKLTVMFFLKGIRCYDFLDKHHLKLFPSDCLGFISKPLLAGFYNRLICEIFVNLNAHWMVTTNEWSLINCLLETVIHESLHYTIFNTNDVSLTMMDYDTHEYLVTTMMESIYEKMQV